MVDRCYRSTCNIDTPPNGLKVKPVNTFAIRVSFPPDTVLSSVCFPVEMVSLGDKMLQRLRLEAPISSPQQARRSNDSSHGPRQVRQR